MQKPFAVRVARMMGLALVLAGGEAFSQDISFFTLPPCRVADTRNPAGPFGGPALSSGAARIFLVAGVCGVPPEATAVAANFTVVQPTAQGHVTAYPGNLAPPLVSSVNFGGGQTRANNAIVPLANNGAGTLGVYPFLLGQGQAHLIVDVFGYFAPEPQATLESSSPLDEEREVAVTRETILRFSAPLAPASVTAAAIAAESAGSPLPARLYLSKDGRSVTLFYDPPLPAGARARVRIDGEVLRDTQGRKVDADRDGGQGGMGTVDFETLSLAVVPGTVVCGRVLASELGTDGSGQTVDVPLEGATVTVDGAEATLRATTDANGNFCLDPAPGSRFFVHLDGRTATNGVPAGAYYPYVGKAWDPVPGRRTNVGTAHLPLVRPGTLQAVSAAEDVVIHFAPSVLQDFPQFTDVAITVPAGSLFADDGTPGGMVGIAPVPPDRLPGQLPPGLEFPVVITVQTDGATNFDSPAPVCFPNLPDPVTGETLAPGEKSALWSFNHNAGRWEVVGPMTITEDGGRVCTDPGVGILAPGWHGARPGTAPDPVPPPDPPCTNAPASGGCIFSAVSGAFECGLAALGVKGALGCAFTVQRAVMSSMRDCGASVATSCKRGQPETCANAAPSCALSAGTGLSATVTDCLVKAHPAIAAGITCGGALGSYLTQCTCLTSARAAASANLALDDLNRHLDVYTAHRDLTLALLGSPAWMGLDPTQGDPRARSRQMEIIYREALAAMALDSMGGALIEGSEALAIQGLPRPWEISLSDVQNLIAYLNRTTQLWRQGILNHADAGRTDFIGLDDIESKLQAVESALGALEQSGRTSFDIRDSLLDVNQALNDKLKDATAPPFDLSQTFFLLKNETSGTVQRGRLSRDGRLSVAALNPDSFYRLAFVHPFQRSLGSTAFRSAGPGLTTAIPLTLFLPAGNDEVDGDADGLPDRAEDVIGSRMDAPDTDGDGSSDGAELSAGTDIFGRDIEIGDVVNGAIAIPQEVDRYSFTAMAGQAVFFDLQAGGTGNVEWELADSAGTVVFDRGFFSDAGPYSLTRGGTYTLTVRGTGLSYTGTYRFQLWNVPPPDTFAIAIGDTVSNGVPGAGAGNIETPGVRDIYTFSASPGQAVFFDYQAGGTSALTWKLVDAAGAVVFDRGFFQDAGPYTLALGGTYTLTIGEDVSDHAGTYRFQLWNVPPPDTFAIAIGDTVSNGVPGAGAGNIETPGVRDIYTFSASPGQSVFFDYQAGGTSALTWKLVDAAGAVVFDRGFFQDAGPYTLALGGTYTLTIGEDVSDHAGTYRFQLWNVPPPDTFAIAIGDTVSNGVPEPGAGNIESPGVRDIYTFSASPGQAVFFDYQAGGTSALTWKLVDAAGTVVFDRGFFQDAGPYTLALGGTYTLTIGEDVSDHAGTYRFQIWNVPPPDTFVIAIGSAVSNGVPGAGAGNIETPGVRDIYTFSASPGQSVFFDYQAGGTSALTWKLVDAAGAVVFDRGFFQDAGPYTLALGGTYTLTIGEDVSDHTGTYAFQVTASP